MYQEKYVDLPNGETLYYVEGGEGDKNVLAIHGNYSSSFGMLEFFDYLPKGYKLFIPDLRGFGRSTYNHPYFSLKEMSDDLILFCKAVGIKKAVVIGHSLGGGVAMQFAIDAKDITEKLLLIAPTSVYGYPIFKEDGKGGYLPYRSRYDLLSMDAIKLTNDTLETQNFEGYKAILGALSDKSNQGEEYFNTFIKEALMQKDLIAADWALMVWNITDKPSLYSKGTGQAKEIQCKTLLISADNDTFVFPFMTAANVAALSGNPNFTHVQYENCGHMVYNDQKERFYKDFVEFIKG